MIDVIESIAVHTTDHCSFKDSVTDGAYVAECIDKVLDQFGRIDVLVTVAGITSFGEVESVSEDEWLNVLNINLSGTFRFCKQVLPIMRRQQRGRIVTIGSLLAKNGAIHDHGRTGLIWQVLQTLHMECRKQVYTL